MLDWSRPGLKYGEMAKDMAAAMGAKSLPIIGRTSHPKQWRDWYAYYGFRKLLASQDLMRGRDEKTVPTLSPFDFDAEFNPTRPSPMVPRDGDGSRVEMTPEQRERHRRLYPFLRGNSVEPIEPKQSKKSA